MPAKHNNILSIHDDIIHIIVEEHIDLRPIRSSPSLGLLFSSATVSFYQSAMFSKSLLFLHKPSPNPSVSQGLPCSALCITISILRRIRPLDASAVAFCRSLVLQLRVVPPDLGLELDELFGDLVVGPLGQYSQDGQSRLVHVDAAAERQPACARALQGEEERGPSSMDERWAGGRKCGNEPWLQICKARVGPKPKQPLAK